MYGEEHFQPTWSSTILITSYPGYGQRELCYSPLDWISVHVTGKTENMVDKNHTQCMERNTFNPHGQVLY